MKIRAQFERKRPQYDLYDCEIEAVYILKEDVFYTFYHRFVNCFQKFAECCDHRNGYSVSRHFVESCIGKFCFILGFIELFIRESLQAPTFDWH